MRKGTDYFIQKDKDAVYAERSLISRHPVYYYQDGSHCFCSTSVSELLAQSKFQREIDPEAVQLYLGFSCLPGERTFYKGIKKLPPGSKLRFKEGKLDIQTMPLQADTVYTDTQSAINDILNCVRESVEAQPCRFAMLSSGPDSSLLAALGGVRDTFTTDYDIPGFSECDEAAAFSQKIGARHHRISIDPFEYLSVIPEVMRRLEQPNADPSVPAYYLLCRNIREYTDRCYSGESVDEFFCGYHNYSVFRQYMFYEKLPLFLRRAASGLVRGRRNMLAYIILRHDGNILDGYKGNSYVITESDKRRVLQNYSGTESLYELLHTIYDRCKSTELLERMQQFDLLASFDASILYCSTHLAKGTGLDIVMPYCSERLLHIGLNTPMSMKVSGTHNKTIFRQAAETVLPPDTAWRIKKGFPVPVRLWMRDPAFMKEIKAILTSATAQSILNMDECETLISTFEHSKEDTVIWRKLWSLYCLIVWLESSTAL